VNDLFAFALLLVNALVVAVAAWLLVAGSAGEGRGPIEPVLAWALAVIGLVAGAGSLLGLAGWLGPGGFLALHAVVLAGLVWRHRSRWPATRATLGEVVRAWRDFFARGDGAAWLGGALLVLWLGLAGLAALAQPVVYDALTYRLSRVGLWLQDGRIAHYLTDDPRLNYMPVVPDLLMAWLTGVFAEGYRLTGLAQAGGGALLLLATAGLGRLTGLGRAAALGAAGLLFGMANVATQFTSVHTDVFTAGIFAAAFFLWLAALRRGQASVWGGIGAGLALGSKGTLFYFAPTALLWVLWLAWRHPLPWPAWRQTLLAGVVSVLVFAGPGFWRNWRSYGSALGPKEMVELHHGRGITASGHLEKLGLNLATSATQLLDPNAEPWWWRDATRAVQLNLAARLPTKDPYAFEGNNRRDWLQLIAGLRQPDADVVSCGLLLPACFAAGCLTALVRRRDPAGRLVLLWGGGIILFVIFLNGMLQWHPFIFRFLALAAPWLAVGAAWWLESLPAWPRRVAWALAATTTLATLWPATMETPQVGWQAVIRPERSSGYFVYREWRDWAARLPPAGSRLTVALPIDRPLAAFGRQLAEHTVQLQREASPAVRTAEQFLQDQPGWLVVPAGRFMGQEGRVQGRTWLFFGQDGRSPYSLAAYRRLLPGEEPAALLYRSLRTSQPPGVTDDLLVRSWTGSARLRLHNASGGTWKFSLLAPDDRQEGVLAAGETREVSLRVPADQVAQVLVILTRQGMAGSAPAVELLP
jgi:hypothetical protein